MVNILPAAPHGTTDQMSPTHAPVPSDEPEDLITEMAGRVADQLDTRSNARGALVIEFADAEDLRRIVEEIDQWLPPWPNR